MRNTMTDRDLPVTEDELHAYADGELPDDRRSAVEAWLAAHPDDMTRVGAWRGQAGAIRNRFGTVAREPVPARFDLDQLAHAKWPWESAAAAAVIPSFLRGWLGL